MAKLRILGNRVMVKPVEEEEQTQGKIVLPDTAKEKPQEGIVVAVGPGKRTEDGELIKPEVSEGDRVIYAKYGGHEVEVDGEKHIILESDQIYAKVVPDERK
ncbi:MAG: co-chaperone GroES [Armatimonadetes bacterium]|nr:co-chaperone GroES [Armatimonadota bacterium]